MVRSVLTLSSCLIPVNVPNPGTAMVWSAPHSLRTTAERAATRVEASPESQFNRRERRVRNVLLSIAIDGDYVGKTGGIMLRHVLSAHEPFDGDL